MKIFNNEKQESWALTGAKENSAKKKNELRNFFSRMKMRRKFGFKLLHPKIIFFFE